MDFNNQDLMNHFFNRPTEEDNNTTVDVAPLENVDEIVLVVDRSGSMAGICEDAQGGINTFINDQREDGEANITLTEFDSHFNTVHDRVPVKHVPEYTLSPRGTTALLDAIGMTFGKFRDVQTTGKKIGVVVTDGHENASTEWTRDGIKKLLDDLRGEGWEFVFLAADESAIQDAAAFGFDVDAAIQMDRNVAGTSTAMYTAASTYTKSLRHGVSISDARAQMDLDVESSAGLKKVNK